MRRGEAHTERDLHLRPGTTKHPGAPAAAARLGRGERPSTSTKQEGRSIALYYIVIYDAFAMREGERGREMSGLSLFLSLVCSFYFSSPEQFR